MTDIHPNEQRLNDIESLLSWATNLLRMARRDTMKDAIRLVICDLIDALQVLRQPSVEERLGLRIDSTLKDATSRLWMVSDAFETIGVYAEMKSDSADS
jgi:hypothetical protein